MTWACVFVPSQVSGINNQAIRQWEERFETDRYGVDICTLTEEVPRDLFPARLFRNGAVHPRFRTMTMSKRSIVRHKGGEFYRATYTFEGYLFEIPTPVYELDASLLENPIQLHPDFETIAGTPSAPANSAIFIDPATGLISTDDSTGVFQEFAAGSSKAGIDSFLDPGATWTEISFSLTTPSGLGDLGEIDSPSGPNPSVSGRNWLLWATSSRTRGFITENRRVWKLSGRGGWDSDLY